MHVHVVHADPIYFQADCMNAPETANRPECSHCCESEGKRKKKKEKRKKMKRKTRVKSKIKNFEKKRT